MGRVGEFLIEPALALGAAAGATKLSTEPLLESLGTGVADQLRNCVAEAAVMGETEFCGGAGPQGPFAKWRRRDSGFRRLETDFCVA